MTECLKRGIIVQAALDKWFESLEEMDFMTIPVEELASLCSVGFELHGHKKLQEAHRCLKLRAEPESVGPLFAYMEEHPADPSPGKTLMEVFAEEEERKIHVTVASEDAAPVKKRGRGRPKKKAVADAVPPAPKELLSPEKIKERDDWAKDRLRPDLLAPPFQNVETVDYFCGSITCDAAMCARDNIVIRIPKVPVDQCYIQYRCSDCGERGQLLYSRQELEEVIAENRLVNYDLLIKHQPKFTRAYEQAQLEFVTPWTGGVPEPRNSPKLLPQPIAYALDMLQPPSPPKEYTPDVLNDLNGIESTAQVKLIVNGVLSQAAPMAADLNVAEADLMAGILGMDRGVLVTQWEALTGATWVEGQNVEESARAVARAILNIQEERGAECQA